MRSCVCRKLLGLYHPMRCVAPKPLVKEGPSFRESLWRSLQLLLMQTDVNGTWSSHNLYSLRMLLCLPGTGRGWYDAAPTEQRWKAGQPGNVDPSSGNAFRSWRHR